jgi:hypothetical protein
MATNAKPALGTAISAMSAINAAALTITSDLVVIV